MLTVTNALLEVVGGVGVATDPYFDGDTTSTSTDVYAWTGTAGASTSTDTYTASNSGTLAAAVPRTTATIAGTSTNPGTLTASTPLVTAALSEAAPIADTLSTTADRAATSKWPQLYDSTGTHRQAVLDSAYGVVVTEQVLDDGSTTNPSSTSGGTGQLILNFSLPAGDLKAGLLKNEMCVLINYPVAAGGQAQDVFVIRTVTTGTDNSGAKIFNVTADGLWYDLGTADPITVTPFVNTTADALTAILVGSGWTIGTIDPAVSGGPTRTFEIDTFASPLAAIRALPGVFGGELAFDTVHRTVSLFDVRGETYPIALYAAGSNVGSDNRVVDTTQLTTRLYPLGAAGLDITTVNGGVGYVEDYSWYDAQVPAWPHVIKAATSTNDTLTDPALLKAWGISQLAMLAIPRVTYTVTPVMLTSDTIPGLGDVVRVWDKPLALNTFARVVQRTLNLLEPALSTLTINTSAFALSSALPSGTPRGTVTPVVSLDMVPPVAPASMTVTGIDVLDGNGNHVEYLTFAWAASTTKMDGSILTDLDHYEVQYRLGIHAWIDAGTTISTTLVSAPMPPGTAFSAQVRAVNSSGTPSAWTVFTGITPGVPVSTLNPPSMPTLDVATFPLCIRATWDGKDSSVLAYPDNFDYLEVHLSTTSGFTPTQATLVDALRASGTSPITGLVAGTPYFVRFVAVETAGYRSLQSAQATATPTTVQDGQIAHMNIAKLLAGSLVADLTVSARIKTADTGARVEINDAGLRAYNTINAVTVAINAVDGSASFIGSISGSSISGGTITGGTITGGTITGGAISGGTITGGAISGGTITGSTISGGTISGGAITGTTIDGSYISGGTISGNTIYGNTISGGAITGTTIDGSYISGGTISGNTISGNTITGGDITGTTITGGTITGGAISGGTITGGDISGGTVTGGAISGGTISSGDISGSWVSASNVSDSVITASTFSTSGGSGSRVDIGLSGGYSINQIRMFNGDSTVSSIRNPDARPGALQMATWEGSGGGNEFIFSSAPSGGGDHFIQFGLSGLKSLNSAAIIQARDSGDTVYGTLVANAFAPPSSLALKDNVTPLTVDALSLVANNGLHAWNWKAKPTTGGVGLIADNMPDWIRVSDGYDLVGAVAILWEAIKQLDARQPKESA